MDKRRLERAARQGLGHIIARTRCPICNCIAETDEEENSLARVDSPCPKCGTVGQVARLAPENYLLVANWIGEYAISSNQRDYVSTVVLFCSLCEALLEILMHDYLEFHPEIKADDKFKKASRSKQGPQIKDVFGHSLEDLLVDAPPSCRDFPNQWAIFRDKRNLFLHGKSHEYDIDQNDAYRAIEMTLVAIHMYSWINNRYCICV